jgi:hypothetical protein
MIEILLYFNSIRMENLKFLNDPAMTALPPAALIKTEDYFPTSTSSVSLLLEECLIRKITMRRTSDKEES